MTKAGKSPELLDSLTRFEADTCYGCHPQASARVQALLTEPDLSRENLLDIAKKLPACNGDGPNTELAQALCGHPGATSDVLISALWNAESTVAANVAIAGKSLTAAAAGWVRRKHILSGAPGSGRATAGTRADIGKLAHKWDAATANNPTLTEFILHNWTAFAGDKNTDDNMLAAGHALWSNPVAP